MKRFSLRWMAWYGDSDVTFDFPNDWDLTIAHIADGEDIGNEGIQKAFETPIGSAPLRDLARGKRRAAIAVDDISRPTQASRLLPRIITELEEGGIERKDMKVVMATGAHRPMNRFDLIKKLGEKAYYTMDIHHHHPFENIVDLGSSSRGTPIHVNRLFMEADIKIGVGCIVPHSYAGFGGGGKIVLFGLAGIDTLEKNHLPAVTGLKAGLNLIEGNENRADIEEVARTVGLDLIVNVVVNSRRGIAGCFFGDPVEAHRAGVERARTIYRILVPEEEFDLAILNPYPKDEDLIQAPNGFNIFLSTEKDILGGTKAIVMICAGPEGAGFHSLQGVGMRLFEKFDRIPFIRRLCEERRLYVLSPYLSQGDVAQYFDEEFECENVMLFRTWEPLLSELKYQFKRGRVVVFPNSTIQLAET